MSETTTTEATTTTHDRGNPRVAFRAPADVLDQIEERQRAWLRDDTGDEGTRGATARRDLERYYTVVRSELERLTLTRAEVLLILDALNGVWVDPSEMVRASILLETVDHVRLNDAGAKWGVDGEALVRRLHEMSPGTLMALTDAAERFWSRSEEHTNDVLRDLGFPPAIAAG